MGNIDYISQYNDLHLRALKIKARYDSLNAQYNDLQNKLEEKRNEIVNLKKSLVIQNTSIDVLKEIIDKLSREHIDKLVDLLTYALQTIFYDKNYSVEVLLGDKRNVKTLDLQLVEKVSNRVIRSSFDSIGGGILSIVGFVMQVYYIGVYNLSSILFIDEGFSQVSSRYIEPLMLFINELAKSKDFIFVLITHDDRLKSKASRTYVVDNGGVTLGNNEGGIS